MESQDRTVSFVLYTIQKKKINKKRGHDIIS